ncbi:exodeoxyribonuclease VII large subunit [Alphaproteobacteria bacterium]|nr:exodeoxyribonuclease VII large subunit [Alphaproteobacteria bacterium]
MSNIPEYTVSELSFLIKKRLEQDFSYVQIKGEISDLKIWNGHFLFNLKDSEGLLAVRIWKNRVPYLNLKPEEGLEITATGKISTHQKRSSYNLIIENINVVGEGELLKLIEARKKKLKEEGLFNKSLPLPLLPERIGIITSLTGAVIQDIKKKISLKFPSHLIIWPISVQGISAEKDLIEAIKGFNKIDTHRGPNVIIIARGGGSIEDLMPFNSEKLANEIYKSKIPIISAVGHETDFTIADFVADHRASTPTAAADLVVPDKKELELKIINYDKNMNISIRRCVTSNFVKTNQLQLRIINPIKIVENNMKILENYVKQSKKILSYRILEKINKVNSFSLRSPKFLVKNREKSLLDNKKNITNTIKKLIEQKKNYLKNKIDILSSSSYEKWLKKGFSIVKYNNGKLIKDLNNLKINDDINIRFFKGVVHASIKKIKKN